MSRSHETNLLLDEESDNAGLVGFHAEAYHAISTTVLVAYNRTSDLHGWQCVRIPGRIEASHCCRQGVNDGS